MRKNKKLLIAATFIIIIIAVILGFYTRNKKDNYIILYDGLEIEKKIGTQYEDYMKNTVENKNKYEILYYNYEKGQELAETRGVFGENDVYAGYSYVENVKKIAISKKYDAMPRKASKVEELPEKLNELADYTIINMEQIDLDGDEKLEYIVCVNKYTNQGGYEDISENEAYSEIILFDYEFNKIATLASWNNKAFQEFSKEMCLQLEDVIYIDIDNDNNMEILISLPSYDASILSILKYSNGKVEGEINYKVNLEP